MFIDDYLDIPLVKSKFSHVFERNGVYLIMHSILMRPLHIDTEAFSVFSRFNLPIRPSQVLKKYPKSYSFIEHLLTEKLIVDENINEIEIFRDWVNKIYNSDGKSIMYIIPTDKCNIHCKYCFIENSMQPSHNFTFMTPDIMHKGVDLFAQHAIDIINPVVIFYGGEPLLNSEIIIESINYISQNYPRFRISILTNGLLVTKKIASLFAEKNVSVGISIDGTKENHDQARIFKNGKGTFNLVIKSIELLRESGCKDISISYTVGSHNVNSLVNDIKYLYTKLHPNSFGINFLVDTDFERNPLSVSIEIATFQVIEAFKFLRKRGIYEDRMMRKVQPFIKGEIHLKDCGAPGNQIVLAPNGDIGPCQAFLPSKKYFTQNVNNAPTIANDLSFNEWSKRYPMNMDVCFDCVALGICGGGCPYQSYLQNGTIWGLDNRMCTHNKLLIDWLVWDNYDSNFKKS